LKPLASSPRKGERRAVQLKSEPMSFRLLDIATGAGTWFDYPDCIGLSRQPFASMVAGPWAASAGPQGCAVGAFGWIDVATGIVTNQFSAGQLLVFTLPHANPYNLWERVFIQPRDPSTGLPPFSQEVVRPGVRLVTAIAGVFSPKFPAGGIAGARVYADPTTGLPYAGNLTGALRPTPYTLMQSGGCGRNLRISSFVPPLQS
jgi:hypothetical protein